MADERDEERKRDQRAKAEQRTLEPNAEGNVLVDVIMGPYRSQRLMMTQADGQAAIDGHWATEPGLMYDPDHEPHDPLSDQERQDALTAATTWAQAQWDAAQGVQPPDPPPPEGGDGGITTRKTMKPEEGEGYRTRHVTVHPEPPKRG